jgi:hypothetical protein
VEKFSWEIEEILKGKYMKVKVRKYFLESFLKALK